MAARCCPGAVIARNLTREIEYFLPVGLLSAGAARGAPWLALCLGLWFLLFTLLPLFNRQRLRAGDLIAGTMVVVLPRRLLLDDLAEHQARFVFAERQLRSYGAFELQVLEELLRRAAGKDAARLRREVTDKICRKIAWTEPVRRHGGRAIPAGLLCRRARFSRARAALWPAQGEQRGYGKAGIGRLRVNRQSNTAARCSTSSPSLVERRS